MDLILKIIEGPDAGKSVPLTDGRHLLGRNKDAACTFSDPEISWEHALIQVNEGKMTLTNLSARGTEVRGRQVGAAHNLLVRERVRLSEHTTAVVEIAGGASKTRVLMLILALLLVVGAGFLLLSPAPKATRAAPNWTAVYLHLEQWAEVQAKHASLPEKATILYRNGWRMQQFDKHDQSAQAWYELMLILKQVSDKPPFYRPPTVSENYKNALLTMLMQEPTGHEDDTTNAAAFVQFVEDSYDWNKRQAMEKNN